MRREDWTITNEHKEYFSGFMGDFWKLIKASYEFPDTESPDSDHYWETLVHWCDALMKKYDGGNDPVINRIVMGYLDGMSCRQNPKKGGMQPHKTENSGMG